MHWMGWLLFSTAMLWLAPGSLWRPVAAALLVQWVVGEFVFHIDGDFEPLWLYLPTDFIVIVCAIWLRSHWSDWLVLAPYPIVWWLYRQPETHEQWEALYWIAFAQFVIAGPWPQIVRALGSYSHGALSSGSSERGGA